MDTQQNFNKMVMDHYFGLRAQGITKEDAIAHCSQRFGVLSSAMQLMVDHTTAAREAALVGVDNPYEFTHPWNHTVSIVPLVLLWLVFVGVLLAAMVLLP